MKRGITCGSTPMITQRQEGGAGRAHGLDLLHRHFLDRLGNELREEAERGDDQRQHAGERTEADRLDEQDGDDHGVERSGTAR